MTTVYLPHISTGETVNLSVQLVEALNPHRTAPLTPDTRLMDAAEIRAFHIVRNGADSQVPKHAGWAETVLQYYPTGYIGESLLYGLEKYHYHVTGEMLVENFQKSDPHWRQLTDQKYLHVGVGLARGNGFDFVAVVNVGGPMTGRNVVSAEELPALEVA